MVDDNATNRQILERTLSYWGMRPTAVSNATAALNLLREANAAGVRSRVYEPGPFSKLELWGVPLITQYIEDLRAQ